MAYVVARIGKPHGIRGEVTIEVRTDDPATRFVAGARFATEATSGSGVPRELTVRSARDHNGVWLLAFEEVPDRTGAEGLREVRLLAEGDDASDDTDENAWYPEELEGLPAYTTGGEAIGTVAGVDHRPAQDLLLITLEDGRTAYVPFVTQLVPVVDVPGRRVVVDAPEGLLDLAE